MTESYVYDKLGRVKETKLANLYTKLFNYKQVGCQTSNLIASEWFGVNGVIKDNLKYSYDEKDNITEVFENGELVQSFEYDSISRLLRENNKKLNKTTTYEYGGGGNIVRKVEYSYTTTQTENLTNGIVVPYAYPVTGWRDQLVSYNNQNIVYDLMGNPTTYLGKTLQWSHGRQLDKIDNVEYKYNAYGIRISKTVNGVTTHFYLDGTKLLGQDNGNLLVFNYGNEGVIGFTYQGVGTYYYKKNIFGDVLSIINSSGQEIVKYVYDAWGKHKTFVLDNGNFVDIETQTSYTQSGSNNKVIAELNPFRYRSYYYDTETGLYYLNSRYYDPSTCKFINADDVSILFEGKDIINGLNLYIYCGNNPITNTDDSGQAWWDWLWKIAVAVVVVVALGVAAAFTGGTAGVILGSAFYGAITGGLSSAVIGGVVGGITNGWNGFLNGFANGLLSGVIVGGATAALTAGINIATGAVKIVGSAQKTGAFFHRFASNVQAGKMAMQIGRYSQITLDRSLNKAGLVGRKMPDVIGTARWGKNLLVEVTSKTQFKYQMINKLNQIVSYNSNVKIKVISWVGWLARLFK